MAILRRCCCFDLRTGSMAVAVWSMLLALGGVTTYIRSFAVIYTNFPAYFIAAEYPAVFSLMLILHLGLGATALMLLIGIMKDKKGMLLPFIAMMGAIILANVALVIVIIVSLTASAPDDFFFDFLVVGVTVTTSFADALIAAKIVYGIIGGIMFIVAIIGVLCILCVFSQFQEMSAGRGRAPPQMLTTTTVQPVGYVGGQVNFAANPENPAHPQNPAY